MVIFPLSSVAGHVNQIGALNYREIYGQPH